eukprot:scaffold10472_cov126-Cylindrotheca_fusiformis.AAC.3
MTTNSRGGNCIVAESDYKAALSAIESKFKNAAAPSDDTATQSFLEETQKALLESLQRIVHPVSDQEFHDIVDPYHIATPIVDADESDSDESITEEEEEEEESIDEETLLDAKAYETAKEKREHVRSLTRRVQQIRQRVLDRVATEASKDFQVDSAKPEIVMEEGFETASLASFQESLNRLDKVLQQSEWENLPKQLQRLQETIDSIQREQDKDRPLSQTEIAIVSRTNSMADEELLEQCARLSQNDYDPTNEEDMDDKQLSPVERLAFFLQD